MKKFILGMFIGLMLTFGLIGGGIYLLVSKTMKHQTTLADNTLLVLDWDGSLPGHQISPAEAGFGTPVSLSRVLEALREAAATPEIKGLLIDRHLDLPREYLQELNTALEEFRRQGKPVLAHLELGVGNAYLAACLADSVSLSPAISGGLLLPGPNVSMLYMSTALQKLGVRVHVLHEGEAKGFGEQYTRMDMSPAVRENLGGLVNDLLDEEMAWVGLRRSLDPAVLKAGLSRPDRLWLTPGEALDLGLVNSLESRTTWEDRIEKRFVGSERLLLSDWISAKSNPPRASKDGVASLDNHIAVLWAEGSIVPGMSRGSQVQIQSRAMIELIRTLKDSDAVRAVVLRVESPGGSALASEEIYQELVQLRESKPLWVSAGPVAASGGYYLAAPAQQIWVSPFSVVGSIGVVALLPDLSAAASRWGLSPQTIQPLPAARLGDLGSPVDPATLAAMQTRMGLIYQEFQSRVLAHRPLSVDQLRPIAGGRVWAGRKALELGLVDRLGGLQECLDSLQAQLGGKALAVMHYPRQENLLDLLLAGNLRPRDLMPASELNRAAAFLGEGGLLEALEQDPARLADPRWSLRAEMPMLLER